MNFARAAGISALILILTALSAAAPASAQDQTAPRCPDADDAITTSAPGYVRDGSALAFELEVDDNYAVREVRITYTADTPSGTASDVLQVDPNEPTVRVIRAVPSGRRSLLLRIDWLQDEGTPSFCAGVDRYPEIPVIAKNAKAGDPENARLKGRFAVRYGKGKTKDDRAVWRLEPLCDVFGCNTRLRSTGGLHGTLTPDEAGYAFERRQGSGLYCVIEYANGSRNRFKIYAYITMTIRTRRVHKGAARELRGTQRVDYEAAGDEFGICEVPRSVRQDFVAKRL